MEISLELPLPPHASHIPRCKLAIESIRFLLFQRQQIPDPIPLLERNYSTTQSNVSGKSSKLNSVQTRRQTCVRKQVSKFLENLDSVEKSLSEFFKSNDVQLIHLTIGSTPLSAKEVYSIDFSKFKPDASSPTTVSPQVVQLCCRRLCAELLQQDEYFLNSASPTNVFIFAKATRKACAKGWQPWPTYKVNGKKLQLSLRIIPDQELSKKTETNKENLGSVPRSKLKILSKASGFKTERLPFGHHGNVKENCPAEGRYIQDEEAKGTEDHVRLLGSERENISEKVPTHNAPVPCGLAIFHRDGEKINTHNAALQVNLEESNLNVIHVRSTLGENQVGDTLNGNPKCDVIDVLSRMAEDASRDISVGDVINDQSRMNGEPLPTANSEVASCSSSVRNMNGWSRMGEVAPPTAPSRNIPNGCFVSEAMNGFSLMSVAAPPTPHHGGGLCDVINRSSCVAEQAPIANGTHANLPFEVMAPTECPDLKSCNGLVKSAACDRREKNVVSMEDKKMSDDYIWFKSTVTMKGFKF